MPASTASRDERSGPAPEAGPGTVGKALKVLDAVASAGRPLRLQDVQALCPFPKATTYRLLQTLTREGMLIQSPDTGGGYALGVRLVRLAHAAWRQSSLAQVARPHLDALSSRLGQTVHLAQLDHAQVLYVDKRNAARPVDMFSEAGKVGPAYCTGVGKALLAFAPPALLNDLLAQQSYHPFTPHTFTDAASLAAELEAVRARGHALDREEHEQGIICVAVPILGAGARCQGALSITGTTTQVTLSGLEALVPGLHRTARAIAADAEVWRFPDPQRPPRPADPEPDHPEEE